MSLSSLSRWPAVGLAGLLVLPAAVLSAGSAAAATPTPSCDQTHCTSTFDASGRIDSFVVPDGVSAIRVALSGAAGGNASRFRQTGGAGGSTTGSLSVTPGQALRVLVGAAGVEARGVSPFGGGGATQGDYLASGGGGSFLFLSDGELVAAAGGGGGAGANVDSTPNIPGGAGGGAGQSGQPGVANPFYRGSPAGPGTPSSGGAGGTNRVGSAGSPGTGPAAASAPGQGGVGSAVDTFYGGGGGGGGYYGGGGGAYADSGAGGSGYAAPELTEVTASVGDHGGNGLVTISWDLTPADVTLSVSPTGTTVAGRPVVLSSTVSGTVGAPTGTVTFSSGGTRLADCTAVPVTAGRAECTTTLLPVGSDAVAARYDGGLTYAPTTSTTTSHQVNPVLGMETTQLPSGVHGTSYEVSLSATGGIAPYSWGITAGTLPAGLGLSPAGTLSGTPVGAGTSTFTASVTDSDGDPGTTVSRSFTVTVARAVPSLAFVATSPTGAVVGDTTQVDTTSDSPVVVTYSASGSCVTTAEGSLTFQHAGTCSVTASQDASADYEAAVARTSIEVAPAPQVIDVTSGTPSDIAVGDTYLPSADGGASGEPVVFGVDEASSDVCSIADGLVTFDGIGSCLVTATQAGTDDYRPAPSVSTTLEVTLEALTLPVPDESTALTATVGTPFVHTFAATGGTAPYVYSATELPEGLHLDPLTGDLLGTPTTAGDTTFTVTVTDSHEDGTIRPAVMVRALAGAAATGQRSVTQSVTLRVAAAIIPPTTTPVIVVPVTTVPVSAPAAPVVVTTVVSTPAATPAASPAATTGTLAHTGAGVSDVVFLAVLALLTGGALLVIRRTSSIG